MKLDKMQFAKVLVYIAGIVQRNNLDSTDITVLDEMIDIGVPEPQSICPKNENVEALMKHMAAGTNKLDAIREHRAITGMGLKDSKEAVERHWPDGSKKLFSVADLRSKLNTETCNATSYAAIEHFLQRL